MVEQVGNIRAAAYELRVKSLFQLRAKVSVLCLACRREAALPPSAIIEHCGWNDRLTKLEARLRCSACRAKGYCKLRIEWIL